MESNLLLEKGLGAVRTKTGAGEKDEGVVSFNFQHFPKEQHCWSGVVQPYEKDV
jgi:hypothetical protein